MNDQCNVLFFYHCPWSWCLIKWAVKGTMLILKACVWKYYWNQPCTVLKTIVCCSQSVHKQGQLCDDFKQMWWEIATGSTMNLSLSLCLSLSVSLSHFHTLSLSFSQSHHSLSLVCFCFYFYFCLPPKHTYELMHSFVYVWNPCLCVVPTELVPPGWRQDIKRPCVCFTTLLK